ncbi:MAG: flavodoxin domain-containing protein [Spirochaetales bacterium]|nr:flavodoxin domain-containing protein [Spirochaetales bacterium]
MKKALIVYGTRYGAAAATSDTIGEVLRKQGADVSVVDLNKDKVRDISGYDLIVVGSGIKINKWVGAAEKFLKKFRNELAGKKVALFVCSGSTHPLDDKEEKSVVIERARTTYLKEKAAAYDLRPVALGLFGGVYDFNKMSWFFRKVMGEVKTQLEQAGVKQTQPGVYDTRDMNAIRGWAKELVRHIRF